MPAAAPVNDANKHGRWKDCAVPPNWPKATCVWLNRSRQLPNGTHLGKRTMLSDCACVQDNGIGWDAKRSPARIGPSPLYCESFSPVLVMGNDNELLGPSQDNVFIVRTPGVTVSRQSCPCAGRLICRYAKGLPGLRHCAITERQVWVCKWELQASTSAGAGAFHMNIHRASRNHFTRTHILAAI